MVFLGTSLFAQNKDGKKIELEFKERVAFKPVDETYSFIPNITYHADDGFKVFSGYDVEDIGGVDYVIFSYPDWKGKEQQQSASIKALLQSGKSVHINLVGLNGKKLAMKKEDFEKLKLAGKVEDVYSVKWKYSTDICSGFMSVPFKLRPAQDSVNFDITTDVTLGAYVGVRKRISKKRNNFVIVPVTLGLSYINVGNNQTSTVNTEGSTGVVPGWSWSTGLVLDLNSFNVGFVLGQDYASGVGDHWLYNKKIWYSFAIGYSFFNNKDKK